MQDKSSKEIASKISGALNTFSFNAEGVAKALTSEHKTLQQNFTRLCVEWLKVCGSENYNYDDRNEASHEVGKKVAPLLDDTCLPFI